MAWSNSSSPTDAQKAIISQLLATDEDLRLVAREFVLQGLRDLRNLQMRGDPAIRASIAKSLAGPITKAITEAGDDDGNSDLRAEMHEMMDEMRGAIMGQAATPITPKALVPKS